MKKIKLRKDLSLKLGTKTLFRIEAIVDIGKVGVKKGDLGGWVEKKGNVSGNAWVFDDAWVSGNARVFGDARVSGNAWVFDDAWVSDDANVSGDAWVCKQKEVKDDQHIKPICHKCNLCFSLNWCMFFEEKIETDVIICEHFIEKPVKSDD